MCPLLEGDLPPPATLAGAPPASHEARGGCHRAAGALRDSEGALWALLRA